MSAHAKFSPSGAHRWMPCPGSMALETAFPNTSSEYADEGTAAHHILSVCLLEEKDAATFAGKWIGVLNTEEDHDIAVRDEEPSSQELLAVGGYRWFLVDEDMTNAVQATLDSVRRRSVNKVVLVEQRVEFTKSIGTEDQQFGTSDIIMISADGETVDVEDYKHGMGVQIYASEIAGYETALDPETGEEKETPIYKGNKQMLSYALGVLETLGGLLGDFKTFNLRVHQPRIDWEDEFTVSVEDVIKHGAEMRAAAIKVAEGLDWVAAGKEPPMDLLSPGEKQCRFCRAKSTCPALTQFVAQSVYDDFEALDDPNTTIVSATKVPTAERLGAAYGALEMIRSWCKAVETEAERRVFAGEKITGPDGLPMKLVEGKKGNRYWVDKEMAEGLLVGVLPPEKVYEPREIVSPSVAEKLVCAGIKGKGSKEAKAARWAQFAEVVAQEPGSPKIALGSDPRPEYKGEAHEDEFQNLDLQDPAS
jgi:hypothetical protein